MSCIMGSPHVVAAHYPGNTPDPAVNDIVIEWLVACPEQSSEEVVDRLVAEAYNPILSVVGI